MKIQYAERFSKMICFSLLLAAGTFLIFLAGVTSAADLPALRKGMWEFKRTIESKDNQGKPQTITGRKCTNPSEDMKKQNEILSKSGCKFSPVSKSGNTYSFTTDCMIQGVSGRSKSIITFESDSAYSINIESQVGQAVTREVLKARRTGDCTE